MKKSLQTLYGIALAGSFAHAMMESEETSNPTSQVNSNPYLTKYRPENLIGKKKNLIGALDTLAMQACAVPTKSEEAVRLSAQVRLINDKLSKLNDYGFPELNSINITYLVAVIQEAIIRCEQEGRSITYRDSGKIIVKENMHYHSKNDPIINRFRSLLEEEARIGLKELERRSTAPITDRVQLKGRYMEAVNFCAKWYETIGHTIGLNNPDPDVQQWISFASKCSEAVREQSNL